MRSFRHIGPGPYGRSIVIFEGGRLEGPHLRGEILRGGGDWEIVREHGDEQTARLDTRNNLLTHDEAVLHLHGAVTRTGEKQVLEKPSEHKIISPDQFGCGCNFPWKPETRGMLGSMMECPMLVRGEQKIRSSMMPFRCCSGLGITEVVNR